MADLFQVGVASGAGSNDLTVSDVAAVGPGSPTGQ